MKKGLLIKSMTVLLSGSVVLLSGCGGSDDYEDPKYPPPKVEIDKNDPQYRDSVSRTEVVPYVSPNQFVDKVSKVALLDLVKYSGGEIDKNIKAENISLFRYPMSNEAFPDTTVSASGNAYGFLLVDDPSLRFSMMGISLYDNENRSLVITRSEIDQTAGAYINRFKRVLGPDYVVDFAEPKVQKGLDGDMVHLSGAVVRNPKASGSAKYPVLQHKRIRDELITAQLNKPAWSKPTLKSPWNPAAPESNKINLELTIWPYKGAVYLFASAYDITASPEQRQAIEARFKNITDDKLRKDEIEKALMAQEYNNYNNVAAKFGRYYTGQDLSSALHILAQTEGFDIEGNRVDRDGNVIDNDAEPAALVAKEPIVYSE